MINLDNLSMENLERIQKVLKIILDELEIQEINELVGNKIPLRKFEKEDIFYDEVISILNKINNEGEKPVLEISNVLLYEGSKDWDNIQKSLKELERFENEKIGLEFLGFSKKDLKENIILRIESLSGLKEIKENVDKKLANDEVFEQEHKNAILEALTKRVEKSKEKAELKKEIIKDFQGELNNFQREIDISNKIFEELRRQITLQTPKNFGFPTGYLKHYEELSKKISGQLAPLNIALEQVKKLQSAYIDYLAPTLQRLTATVKATEERIKELNPPPEPSKGIFISSDVVRIRQGDETISKLGNIETLLQGLLSKNKEKSKQVKTIKPEEFKEIRKITLIEMNNGKYLIAINDNYKEVKKLSMYSEWWQIFIQEVKNRNLPYDRRTNVKEIPKKMVDFFNYNKKCSIYLDGKYKLTNIFAGRSIDTMINPDIKTEIISEKKYLRRKQKQEKIKK